MPLDRALLEIFAAEQAEHVQRLRALTGVLAAAPPDAAAPAFQEALRRAHTLKGAARAVGLEKTEELCHRLETLFARSRDSGAALDPRTGAAIHQGLDAIEDLLAGVLANRSEPPPPLAPPADLVRVHAAGIDELIRTSSQLLAATGAESIVAAHTRDLAVRAAGALDDYLRLRRDCIPYLRDHEDDPAFAPVRESLEYAGTQLRELLAGARTASTLQQHSRWELRQRAAELHQNAVRVRMIPAESVFGAFGAMVREIAHEEGKEVDFRSEGLEVQADRVVLQALKDPVMHLLRNAVSHGIEPPGERLAAGKTSLGFVRLSLLSRGQRLRLSVEDDGRGLDLGAVAQQAVARGLLTSEEAAAQSRQDLARLIFEPGLSTSPAVTSLSGRGMGMSVVEQAVSQLQGEVDVRPRPGGGLQIIISVALSISTQHILLLSSGAHRFGIASHFVHRLLRLALEDVETVEGREMILVDARPVPLVRLRDLLGLPGEDAPSAPDPDRRRLAVAVIVSAEQRAAVQVDEFLDEREMVVKELGLPVQMAGLTAGGVPLEDGAVAPVLNAAALFDRLPEAAKAPGLRPAAQSLPEPPRRILVVDDSITTRSLEKSILEAHGYQVRVAVDGLEALEQLRAEPADLVITDVMMPRMDGLQLLEQMKKQQETAHVPVIIVTSLDRREDQERGLSLGADAYIVKRKFDARELLDTVRQIL